MSTKVIEQQLTDLQKRVASLEAAVRRGPRESWKQIIGISKGQVLDREAALLGAKWRMKENRQKIASICLVHDGLLLTRNLSDFEKVPGLRVENWLD